MTALDNAKAIRSEIRRMLRQRDVASDNLRNRYAVKIDTEYAKLNESELVLFGALLEGDEVTKNEILDARAQAEILRLPKGEPTSDDGGDDVASATTQPPPAPEDDPAAPDSADAAERDEAESVPSGAEDTISAQSSQSGSTDWLNAPPPAGDVLEVDRSKPGKAVRR